jgi:hypothetical protein
VGATSWRKVDPDRARSDAEDTEDENEQVGRAAEAEADEQTALVETDESDDE